MIRRLNRLMIGFVVLTSGIIGVLWIWYGVALGLAHLVITSGREADQSKTLILSALLMAYVVLCYLVGKWIIGRYHWLDMKLCEHHLREALRVRGNNEGSLTETDPKNCALRDSSCRPWEEEPNG